MNEVVGVVSNVGHLEMRPDQNQQTPANVAPFTERDITPRDSAASSENTRRNALKLGKRHVYFMCVQSDRFFMVFLSDMHAH